MSEINEVPSPQETDSNEVRWALETATTLWTSDPREALRWLRRAAESASDAGDDLRSVQLASAAADLRNSANVGGSLPPAASAPPPAGVGGMAFGAEPTVAQAPIVIPRPVAVEEEANGFAADSIPTSLDTPAAQAQAAQMAASAQSLPESVVGALAGASATATPLGVGMPSEPPPSATEVEQLVASPARVAGTASANTAGPAAVSPSAAPPSSASGKKASTPAPAEEAYPTPAESPASIAYATQAVGEAAAPPETSGAPQGSEPGEPAPTAVVRTEAQAPVAVAAPPHASASAAQVAPAATAPRGLSHQAVRVAVSRAPAANGLYQLHRLAEGESLPDGWSEALLVSMASGEIFDV